MPVTGRQQFELDLVLRLFAKAGITPDGPLQSSDRPDVIAHIEGRWTGIEVTVLHADDHTVGTGSRLRQQEQALALTSPVYGMFIDPSPISALTPRVAEKVRKSAGYLLPDGGELWLYLACAIPSIGQSVSTHVLPGRVAGTLTDIDPILQGSRYSRAFIYAIMRDELFEWTPTHSWVAVAAISPSVTPKHGPLDLWRDGKNDMFIQKMIDSRCEDDEALDAEIQATLAEIRSR